MSIKNLTLNFSLINSEIMGKLICNYEISKENKTSEDMFHFGKWQQKATCHDITEILLKMALNTNQSIKDKEK